MTKSSIPEDCKCDLCQKTAAQKKEPIFSYIGFFAQARLRGRYAHHSCVRAKRTELRYAA